jgi:hypothetical protein
VSGGLRILFNEVEEWATGAQAVNAAKIIYARQVDSRPDVGESERELAPSPITDLRASVCREADGCAATTTDRWPCAYCVGVTRTSTS